MSADEADERRGKGSSRGDEGLAGKQKDNGLLTGFTGKSYPLGYYTPYAKCVFGTSSTTHWARSMQVDRPLTGFTGF
jgi:hypothetical protein